MIAVGEIEGESVILRVSNENESLYFHSTVAPRIARPAGNRIPPTMEAVFMPQFLYFIFWG